MNYQHFNLFIVGFPLFIKHFSNSFIYWKFTQLLPYWLSAFIPSINFIYLYYIYFYKSYNPSTIFCAYSINFISSLDVWSARIFWDTYCFFSHWSSVFSTFSNSSKKCSLISLRNCVFLCFKVAISSSKLAYAFFKIVYWFSYKLNLTCLISNKTF